jgi:hypothetical protein
MYGRKVSRFVGDVLRKAGIWQCRRKVCHSLRSNFQRKLDDLLFPDNLISRMMGHSTGKMKDQKYNETDLGPGFPMRKAIPLLDQARFPITVMTWPELVRSRAA